MAENSELLTTLQQANLSEKESRIYLSLLSLGSATAYKIAGHSGVKKPTVYVILEDLRKKGLVLKVPHAKKALFSPRSMEEYLQEQREKLSSVQAILPRLDALGGEHQPGVFFFSGLRGIAEAIEYKKSSMRGKTMYAFYGNLIGIEDVTDFIKLYENWDRQALAAGIRFKILMPKKESAVHHGQLLTFAQQGDDIQIRFLNDNYPPNASIGIGEDFLWILDEKNAQATVIDNKSTATAMRQIFNIVWEKGV